MNNYNEMNISKTKEAPILRSRLKWWVNPLMVLSAIIVVSCEREIGFDYPTSEAKIVFDGEISNEGVFVRISRTRPMADSTKNHFISTA